jgi:hypothetical protein
MNDIKEILDIKLKNNDKYIIKHIISFLHRQCYYCNTFNCEKDLEIVYIGNNCKLYEEYCKKCISDLGLYYCFDCNAAHYSELMHTEKTYCKHCRRVYI